MVSKNKFAENAMAVLSANMIGKSRNAENVEEVECANMAR
jgi:hypothetical protein